MSDTDSDVEVMNSGGEEHVEAPPPTAPKPTKKKKKSKKSKSDAKAAEKAREKRQKELKENDLSDNDSDNEKITEDTVMSKMLMRMDNLELKNTELQKEIDNLKAINENAGRVFSGNKIPKTKTKAAPIDPKLKNMTARQVQTLVASKACWGDYDMPEDKEERKKLFQTKPKLPNEITNKKLREFVEDALSKEDLMDELDIELIDDEKIKTHSVTKIIKHHCKENDGLIITEFIKDNGKTGKETHYNLTEGDFEDMFDEYVSSD